MGEFVNPKYADSSKTTFKKPARLECMMQDYPKVLREGGEGRLYVRDAWISFSPCKNAMLVRATKSPRQLVLYRRKRTSTPTAPRALRWQRVCHREAVDAGGMGRRRRRQPKAGHRLTAVVPATSLKGLKGRVPSPKFVTVTERSTLS